MVFYTIQGDILPLSEIAKDNRRSVILLQINQRRLYAINFNDDYSIEQEGTRITVKDNVVHDETAEVSRFHGLKKSEKYVFPSFLRKVSISLPKGNNFTNKQVGDSVSNAL